MRKNYDFNSNFTLDLMTMKPEKSLKSAQTLLIIVASLGYFVDIYDLILYNIVKKESLLSLGYLETEIKSIDGFLFRCQMGGMLIGGLLWGILGDTKGRLKVLFGSILMYSVANIANAFVWDLSSYAVIRFIAGVGLAGELGAGITLIVETMDKEKRGYGTMIIVTFGALGAVFAYLVADIFQNWKISYIVGGAMGLALLALRIGAYESRMYKEIESHEGIRRGDFLSLFTQKTRLKKYLWCIAMGLPVWFVVGILINLTESYFEPYLKLTDDISTGKAVLFCYLGLSVGDFLSGVLSQINKSRLRVVQLYLIVCCLLVFAYMFILPGTHSGYFYTLCFLLGGATGYWALFVTVAAEQFGTNIRSTVTSTVPNFVRGAVIPITLGFELLANTEFLGIIGAVIVVGVICIGLAILAAYKLEETFGKDLNYHEL